EQRPPGFLRQLVELLDVLPQQFLAGRAQPPEDLLLQVRFGAGAREEAARLVQEHAQQRAALAVAQAGDARLQVLRPDGVVDLAALHRIARLGRCLLLVRLRVRFLVRLWVFRRLLLLARRGRFLLAAQQDGRRLLHLRPLGRGFLPLSLVRRQHLYLHALLGRRPFLHALLRRRFLLGPPGAL